MKKLFATVCGLALVASASVHADHRAHKHDGYAVHGYQHAGHYNKHYRAHGKHYNKHHRSHGKHCNKHYGKRHHRSDHYRGHKYWHAPRFNSRYGSHYGSRYYNAPRHRAGHHAYNRHNDGLTLLGGVLVGKLLHDSVHHDRHRAVAPSNSRHERHQRPAKRRDNGRDRNYVSPRHQRDERRR